MSLRSRRTLFRGSAIAYCYTAGNFLRRDTVRIADPSSTALSSLESLVANADGQDFDPVTLEIFWNRLISIADESAAALVRTSFSTIVRESNDFATVLMDANGDSLAENTAGIPSFVGILPRTLRKCLERIPLAEW